MPFLRRQFRSRPSAQPRLAGIKRIAASIAAIPEIRDCIEEDCRAYHVSPGFVIMTIVAKHYRIDEQPDFKRFIQRKKGR